MTARICTVQELNQLIVDNLHKIRALPFDVVVHLPRSGTIPASLIATYLVRPFCSVDEYCAGIIPTRKSEFSSLDRILLVDDSLRTGGQMSAAIERILAAKPNTKICKFSVYSTPVMRNPDKDKRILEPDLFLSEHIDDFYIYPWFMWKTPLVKKMMFDMDGVLCRDCSKEEDDDGPAYLEFLKTAQPKFKSIHEMGIIVTSRLEKYRPQTEAWLRRNGYQYRELIMGPWRTLDERKASDPAKWKGRVYRDHNGMNLFVESAVGCAKKIAEVSTKTVFCIDNSEVYNNVRTT